MRQGGKDGPYQSNLIGAMGNGHRAHLALDPPNLAIP